jgi:3-hydroxyisobutyrate dehydrogenase-like beta-hydroxyacid dehydrogenase
MNVGFIGLGSIGKPMAMNVVKAGHKTTVHDVRPEAATELLEAGAVWADTPEQTARGNEVIMTSLPGPVDVEAVVLGDQGVLEGAAEGAVHVDLTTNAPSVARRLHRICGARGVGFLDAGVSKGSRADAGAEAAAGGHLTMMVGGDRETLERVRPVLNAIADKDLIFYCGPSGAGAVSKLCNNMVGFATTNALVEALTIGVKAGVAIETLSAVIAASSASRPKIESFGTVFEGDFEPKDTGYLRTDAKDMRLATELARELDVPVEIAAMVDQRYVAALAAGLGHLGGASVIKVQEDRSGVELRYAK